jgi:hypothetical protein
MKMAVKDYSDKKYMAVEEHRIEITTFFKSKNFYNICQLLSIDETDFFDKLKHKEKINIEKFNIRTL